MATRGATARQTPKTAMEWARQLAADPEHQDAIEALMTEIDLRQGLIVLREERGLTQVELAKRLGVSQPVIAKLEGGKTKDVKLSTLVRVAAALGARVKIALEKHAEAAKPKRQRKTAAA